jgi:hypothetical protein
MSEYSIRNFSNGVLDPALHQNVNLELWHSALNECFNFIVLPKGGISRRPGTRFIGEVRDSTKVVRLIPFKTADQEYILVFNDQYMQVIKNGEFVETSPSVRYELAVSGMTSTILSEVKYSQDGDKMLFTHQQMNVKILEYTSETSWTWGNVDFTSQVGVPIWSATLPSFNIGTGGGTFAKDYTYVLTAVDANGIESLASVFHKHVGGQSLTETYGIRLLWNLVTGASSYKVYKNSNNALGFYGYIGECTTTFFDDYNLAANMAYQPPAELTPFTIANNKPGAVGFYQQRSIFGGSIINPDTVWTSKVAEYFSLRISRPSVADDAITFRVKNPEPVDVKHIIAINDLIVLASGAEFLVTEGQDFVLTPTTVGSKPQSYFGCNDVTPVVIEDDVLFVQAKGNELRNLGFTLENSKYIGNNLSLKAEHLFSNNQQEAITIVDMAYADHPFKTLWCIMSNGELYGVTYHPRFKTWGWHRHDTPDNGNFENVSTVQEDSRDAAYFVVKRGSDRFIERLEPAYNKQLEDSFYVDSGITYDGSPATVITGLDHLEGKQVNVLADGIVVGPYTVSSGQITLDDPASVVQVGFSYESRLKTLGIDSAERTQQGKVKNVSEVVIRFIQSVGGGVYGEAGTGSGVEVPIEYDDGDPPDTYEYRTKIHADWNDDGRVTIIQDDPLPMSIAAITPRFDIGG